MTIEPNDPTRSGMPLPSGSAVVLSFNEIESLCLKAARGAGMSWGQAEEAGFAAAWLAKRGFDGPSALLLQLQAAAERPWRDICPVIGPGAMRPKGDGPLCPIALGTTICDFANLPETGTTTAPLQIGPVSQPVLLMPFLSVLAAARRRDVELDWARGTAVVSAGGEVSGDCEALEKAEILAGTISLRPSSATDTSAPTSALRLSSSTLHHLNAFAMRTTVPPSEKSRSDAGAGTTDND